MWKITIIELGLEALIKILNRSKKSKRITDFLFSEKTQKTFADVYRIYTQAVDEWEEQNEET